METLPVISEEALKLEGLDLNTAIKNLCTEQPNVLAAVIGEYKRLPQTALAVYHLIRTVLPEPVLISQETVEALDSIIQTDKEKLGKEFVQEQPHLGQLLMKRYEYIPKPALLLYFGYKNQVEANQLNGSNLMKETSEEEKHLRYLIQQVYQSLPSNKDWLDPVLEAEMKDVASK